MAHLPRPPSARCPVPGADPASAAFCTARTSPSCSALATIHELHTRRRFCRRPPGSWRSPSGPVDAATGFVVAFVFGGIWWTLRAQPLAAPSDLPRSDRLHPAGVASSSHSSGSRARSTLARRTSAKPCRMPFDLSTSAWKWLLALKPPTSKVSEKVADGAFPGAVACHPRDSSSAIAAMRCAIWLTASGGDDQLRRRHHPERDPGRKSIQGPPHPVVSDARQEAAAPKSRLTRHRSR